ncbi:MAG: HAMP domain-containing histidine kinase [Chloroflexi bacterium]|nr:HAMP domain-containing histidine kinase [Chloroflexota bacterium]
MLRFKNIRLAIKMILLVLVALGVLLLTTIVLLNRNTNRLTQEIGSEQASQEVTIIENRLEEVEKQLLVDIDFFASSVPFFQAVGRRNANDVSELVTRTNASLELDDIDVVDGDGNRLYDLHVEEDFGAENTLLAAGLANSKMTTLIIEKDGDTAEISITAVAPVVSVTGNVLGAVQISRKIDDAFLDNLIFNRSVVQLGLIYQDQIRARTLASRRNNPSSETILYKGIAYNLASVQQAENGQAIIEKDLIDNESNVPNAVAYIPVLVDGETSPAVIMLLLELQDIHSFQNSTLLNTVFVFATLTLIALSVIYLTLYQIIIRPIGNLTTIAQKLTSGQYQQRAPADSKDEVGQLARAFNEMAAAIEQRETSLQGAREQAENANRIKSQFLANMSHELRTPLNAILNFTAFVADGVMGPVNEAQSDALAQSITSSKHLLSLINDILDLTKIEAGLMDLFIQSVDMNEVMGSIVSVGKGLVKDKPIDLIHHIQEQLPVTYGDKRRLRQVFLNMVSNAVKFTPKGSVTIKANFDNGKFLITVQDTGVGIPKEDYDLVFESFKQAKHDLPETTGTGLGMPISRYFVESHNGKIWFESVVGQGTTFYVELPLLSVEEANQVAQLLVEKS